MDYEGKSVLILGGGDGGILNMLRTKHNPKVIILWQGWKLYEVFIFNISIFLVLYFGYTDDVFSQESNIPLIFEQIPESCISSFM